MAAEEVNAAAGVKGRKIDVAWFSVTKKQENGFVALYDPSHLITRRHVEHKEKDIFRFVIIKILCGLCDFV